MHLYVIIVEDHHCCCVAMVPTVVGGREDGGHVGPGVIEHPIVVVSKADPIFLALVGTDDPKEPVLLKKWDDGCVAEKVRAAARRVWKKVKLLKLWKGK